MGILVQDLRYGLRALRKSPGFTAVIILTLALGIGANTAIFSIVDAVLLRALPFPAPGELVRVVDNVRGFGLKDIGMSVPELQDLAGRSGVFEQISATWPVDLNITGTGHPERAEFLGVSANYFTLLGAKPQLGRVFGPQDVLPGFSEAVVISDGLWKRFFGGDPNVLGRKVRMDNDVYVVVGVMPPNFRHPGRTLATDVEVWATAGFTALPFPPPQRTLNMIPGAIARLKPGLSVKAAQARLDAFTAALRREFPNDYRPESQWSVDLEPLQDAVVGNVRPLLLVLSGSVALMLLIGCANIANLLLARAAGRQREVAIRQALGAARTRLIRQWLTESLLLSLIAGAVGVLCAASTLRLLLGLVPSRLPRLNEVALDARVLLFALAVSIVTGVLFGLAPALSASGWSVSEHLKETTRGGSGRRQTRVSGLLVVSEFAICLVLMIGAGLLVRSFWKLSEMNPGFEPNNVLVERIWLPVPNDPASDPYAKPDDRTRFAREVLRRAAALTGVTHAALTTSVPLGGNINQNLFTIENRAVQPGESLLGDLISITPDYFKALGTPLLEGRYFTESDQAGAPDVALVDHATAQRYWPNQSAIGKRLKRGRLQSRQPWAMVVGVVGDIRHDGMNVDGVPHLYFPMYQVNNKALGLVLRTSSNPASLGEVAKREIQAVDPNLPVFGIRTLSDMVSTSVAQQRFSAQLMAAFATVAMLLAGVGIYGVLAYSIGQRTREIGVRVALGAGRWEVVRMVVWQGLRLILTGIVTGVACALAFSRLLSRLVFGISLTDPLVFAGVPLILLAIAILASYIPAHRATRIDPMVALRAE